MSFFTIGIDTESDDAWNSAEKIKLDNFDEIPRFQNLCERYNIIPTYFLTYEYAIHKPAIDFFKSKIMDKKCEIGQHFHSWSTPDKIDKNFEVDSKWIHAYQYELPDDIFIKKSEILYNTIKKNFDILPKSYRAGRYGIDQRTVDWLCSKGFHVDSSVVSNNDYRRNKGKDCYGPNFLNYSNELFRWYDKYKIKYVNEYPISSVYPSYLSRGLLWIPLFKKLLNRLGFAKPLRPYPNNLLEINKIINNLYSKGQNINMMLHSSELCLGCSPISMNKSDYDSIWFNLEETFILINKLGLISTEISNIKK